MRVFAISIGLTCLFFCANTFAAECKTDAERAKFELLKRSADSGNPNAQYELGRMHEYAECTEADDTTAIHFYELASLQGNALASYRLGVLYDNGWGTKEEDETAVAYYRKAAIKNHPLAQHDLAIMYLHGTGVAKDYKLAYKWLYIAVERGNAMMNKHLQRVIALMTKDEIADAQSLANKWLSEN